ncbi:retrovirus-related pol polyprotein from transposon TNT 1-94 [Tanacetum coccineum]
MVIMVIQVLEARGDMLQMQRSKCHVASGSVRRPKEMDSQYFKDKSFTDGLLKRKEMCLMMIVKHSSLIRGLKAPNASCRLPWPTCHPLEMHLEVHLDSDAETVIDEYTISYHQFLLDTEAQIVPSEVLSGSGYWLHLPQSEILYCQAYLEKDICSIVLTSDIVVPPSSNAFAGSKGISGSTEIVLWYLELGCSRHAYDRLIVDLSHNLILVGQFCDGGLDVAFLSDIMSHPATTIWLWIYAKVVSNVFDTYNAPETGSEASSSNSVNIDVTPKPITSHAKVDSCTSLEIHYWDKISTCIYHGESAGKPTRFARLEATGIFIAQAASMILWSYLPDGRGKPPSSTSGFTKGVVDPTLFTRKTGKHLLLVQIYVDDIIFASTNPKACKLFAFEMNSTFKMSMMGQMSFFLGLQVSQNPSEASFINQSKYAKEILNNSLVLIMHTSSTPPMAERPIIDEDKGRKLMILHDFRDADYAGCHEHGEVLLGSAQFLGHRNGCCINIPLDACSHSRDYGFAFKKFRNVIVTFKVLLLDAVIVFNTRAQAH